MPDDTTHDNLLGLTTEIVSAHLSSNQVSSDEIPLIIQKVYKTLSTIGQASNVLGERPQPAVPIKKSIVLGGSLVTGVVIAQGTAAL